MNCNGHPTFNSVYGDESGGDGKRRKTWGIWWWEFFFFLSLLLFVVGGLGFELCVFVAGWRHALQSEWPFIIII